MASQCAVHDWAVSHLLCVLLGYFCICFFLGGAQCAVHIEGFYNGYVAEEMHDCA